MIAVYVLSGGAKGTNHDKHLLCHGLGWRAQCRITIRARNIATAFEVAERSLNERHPKSDVIVQAVQRIAENSRL